METPAPESNTRVPDHGGGDGPHLRMIPDITLAAAGKWRQDSGPLWVNAGKRGTDTRTEATPRPNTMPRRMRATKGSVTPRTERAPRMGRQEEFDGVHDRRRHSASSEYVSDGRHRQDEGGFGLAARRGRSPVRDVPRDGAPVRPDARRAPAEGPPALEQALTIASLRVCHRRPVARMRTKQLLRRLAGRPAVLRLAVRSGSAVDTSDARQPHPQLAGGAEGEGAAGAVGQAGAKPHAVSTPRRRGEPGSKIVPASQPAFARLRARLLLGELRLASQRAIFVQRAPRQAKAVSP